MRSNLYAMCVCACALLLFVGPLVTAGGWFVLCIMCFPLTPVHVWLIILYLGARFVSLVALQEGTWLWMWLGLPGRLSALTTYASQLVTHTNTRAHAHARPPARSHARTHARVFLPPNMILRHIHTEAEQEDTECCRRAERSLGPPSGAGDRPRTTAVDRRSTPSARADRQEPLPMFRCPGCQVFLDH